WVFSLLCIRRYQKRLPGSFVCGIRKAYLPIISVALLCAGVMLWILQPFVNHAPYEWNNDYNYFNNPTSASAEYATYKLTAGASGCVSGNAEYTITKTDNLQDSIWLDPGYRISSVTCDGKNLAFNTLCNDVNEYRQTTFTIPKGNSEKLVIQYQGIPQMERSWLPFFWDNNSSADYVSLTNAATVPNFTSFTLPTQYDLELTLPEKLTPIVEHQLLTNYTQNSNGTRTWKETAVPGSLGWITACNYANVQFEATGATINLLYSKKYDQNIKKYNIPQSITDVMNYCTTHLGPLPFVDNGTLMMVQRSSISGDGGNAGDGWVEWTEFLFTEKNLRNQLKGASAAEVFAHEIIHEWWGGFGVYCEDDGLWSDEGLDVYTTYRLMKEKYGALYAQQNYVNVWQAAVDEQDHGYYYRHPEMLSKLPEKYQAELKSQAQEINRYCRMPLMILKVEQLVGGEANMDKILQSIQQKYSQDPNIYTNPFTYQEFLDSCGLKARDLNLE
ncbi:MAG TPA: M1 family aminopeptidase, partial [Mobilitalea sp.]|nr:M1 family aminopeptidase [Mobilitalea sp.]